MFIERDIIVGTLHKTLDSCSKLIKEGDYENSKKSISDLVDFLTSISDYLIEAESENEDFEDISIEILVQIHQYLASPSIKQEVIDALAFEVPKAVVRFAHVSGRCMEVAENVVDLFVEKCGPRDMLPILCEALGSPSELFTVSVYFIPILSGLVKVIFLIQRRHYEQVKTVVPVVLNVLSIISFKSDDEDEDYEKLFHKAIDLANSIKAVHAKLEGKDNHKLRALLGLYILQIMALVSTGMRSEISRNLQVVLELSDFLRHCELSYIGLITGCEVDVISKLVLEDDSDDDMGCFSQIKLGAALGVIWGYQTSEDAMAAKADMSTVIMELQNNWTSRWEAIGMLKHIFSCPNLSWELKKHAIGFLLCIMDGIVSPSYDNHLDYSVHMATFYTSLQAIEMVIMYASDALLRKNAFDAFKKVLADIPTSVRLDVLRALITSSESSSMIGILIDLVKEELRVGRAGINSSSNLVLKNENCTSFWSPLVLEFVEVVLRPPNGGPPSLPEYSDAVLSALNLYRFIFITESTGDSNYTGILSKDKLHKAYNEWLLPLRSLVTRTMVENQNDCDELESDIIFGMNPVELVLYRCIELVEEKLKHL
ncbi:hypothetical protein ACJIZ3_009864 [Penstemon smallii]|uniref:Aberrant root formation protein 4 n=1 Tax=Penstemon smallii TaxID=265156 RepID=A0ABD3TG13_9LAMI